MACSCCSVVDATSRHFDEVRVRKELAAHRRDGPPATTQGLLRLLAALDPLPETMLDIGSGIGALSSGMLRAGVQHAICVDMSRAALRVNEEEAQRLGIAERVEQREGDFVELAPTLPEVDLVTLDRVVCCYPAYAPLLEAAAAHCRRRLALSFPRDRWWVRLAIWGENRWRRWRGDAFRAFVHSPRAMADLLERHGLVRSRVDRTWTWQLEVYERDAAAARP